MTEILELSDSFLDGKLETDSYNNGIFMKAIDELNKQFDSGNIQIIKLNHYMQTIHFERPIWYEILSYTTKYYNNIPFHCNYYSSHYIGRFSNNETDIVINPRFGSIVFNYILNYATNLFLPEGTSATKDSSNNFYWLIALLWKAMLNKAITLGQTPKEYQQIKKNLRNYRGRLCVPKHIHYNASNASMFYCKYNKLSLDNTINRTIRNVYKVLQTKNIGSLIDEFAEYDSRLSSFGVQSEISDLNKIDSIQYTKMTIPYYPVMQLSKNILSNVLSESSNSGSISNISYFIDVAELWEMYLLKLLQNRLNNYFVYSPNALYGDFLIQNNMREIRPDIIIKKDAQVVMIIDAKYKEYKSFGSTSKRGVSREDLYQMTTYLYHYGEHNKPIIGIFTAPTSQKEPEHYFFSNKNKHQIGLLNLNIKSAKTIDDVHKSEDYYIKSIESLLKEQNP